MVILFTRPDVRGRACRDKTFRNAPNSVWSGITGNPAHAYFGTPLGWRLTPGTLALCKGLRVSWSAEGIVASERQALAISLCDEGMPQHSAAMDVDTLQSFDTIWEAASVGACRRDFCSTTRRRKRHFMNTAFLNWTGIHPEEWFTRIQNRELGIS